MTWGKPKLIKLTEE